jgi:hypothetical protein
VVSSQIVFDLLNLTVGQRRRGINLYQFRPFSEPPTDLNDSLKSANQSEFRQRYGEYIEKYGGLHNPGFN